MQRPVTNSVPGAQQKLNKYFLEKKRMNEEKVYWMVSEAEIPELTKDIFGY